MFSLLRRRFASHGHEGDATASPADEPFMPDTGEGVRVYAIGDVHGRLDLLKSLLEQIVTDSGKRGAVDRLRLVMLGDLIDRGPQSAQVVDLVMAMREAFDGMTCLMGNHEEMFLTALRGDARGLSLFRRMGRETLLSYGIDDGFIDGPDDSLLLQAMLTAVPEAHRDFLRELPDSAVVGDYLFVHAGIRPGIALDAQDGRDLRWIRREFLSSRLRHSHMVVHGHSITEAVDEQPNRIGIDTGAYATGRLTCLKLEEDEREFLAT
ncbi:MAG: metallophosphoesterase family protein [Sphingobium sp.]